MRVIVLRWKRFTSLLPSPPPPGNACHQATVCFPAAFRCFLPPREILKSGAGMISLTVDGIYGDNNDSKFMISLRHWWVWHWHHEVAAELTINLAQRGNIHSTDLAEWGEYGGRAQVVLCNNSKTISHKQPKQNRSNKQHTTHKKDKRAQVVLRPEQLDDGQADAGTCYNMICCIVIYHTILQSTIL